MGVPKWSWEKESKKQRARQRGCSGETRRPQRSRGSQVGSLHTGLPLPLPPLLALRQGLGDTASAAAASVRAVSSPLLLPLPLPLLRRALLRPGSRGSACGLGGLGGRAG